MKMEKICPRCGKVYSEESAVSRVAPYGAICSDCGMKEAMDSAGFSKEDQEKAADAVRAAREQLGH